MKKYIVLLMVGALLALGGQAFGEMCTVDAVPAATLLLPYFEVDLSSDTGVTTLFSINNASAAPALAHVTIWSNWTIPVIDFDIFLTGYDVQTINMRDIMNGYLPVTAHAYNDDDDDISPHGDDPEYGGHDEWDSDPDNDANPRFASCDDVFPFDEPALGTSLLDRVQNGLTGQAISTGDCLGYPVDSGYAVGYITVDNVNRCSTKFPPENNYFVDGGALPDDSAIIANNLNYLWGDWFIVDAANNFAFGDNLVHVEADSSFNAEDTDSGYTFYGRYWGPGAPLRPTATGADNREPLGINWGVRYLNGGPFSGGTDLIVWRDSTDGSFDLNGVDCEDGPAWWEMNEAEVVAFDEKENAAQLCYSKETPGGVISPPDPGSEDDPACFPLETQRVDVAGIGTPFDFGWLFLDLRPSALGDSFGDDDWDPPGDATLAQSYVIADHSAEGRYSVGLGAIELRTACEICLDDDDPCSIVENYDIEFGPLPGE